MKTIYLFFQKYSVLLSGVLLFIFASWSAYIMWQVEYGKEKLDKKAELTSRLDNLSKDFKNISLFIGSDYLFKEGEEVEVDAFLQQSMQDIKKNISVIREQELSSLDNSLTKADSLLQVLKNQIKKGQDQSLADVNKWVLLTKKLDNASTQQEVAVDELRSQVNSYWHQLYFVVFIACGLGFLIVGMLKRQKKYVNVIEHSKEQAETAARHKSDFLAMMSHEIRTPMNAVIGMTDLVMETDMTKEQKEYIRTIKIAGENLLSIINDVLDFSKLESGNMKLNRTRFDLEELISDVFNLMSIKVKEKNLETSWHIDENVPHNIKTDKARLRQVLINLVGNAVKFTEEGEVTLSVVTCGSENGKHCLRFSVRDTGMGIPEEELPHLFNFFSQVDVNNKEGGTGLGLAISKEIVNMMGGEINVESEVNEGTTFYFTIYADAVFPDKKEIEVGRAEESTQEEMPLAQNKSVLIAEDDKINQLVASRVIENIGFTADVVSNGQQAVEAVTKADYAFIFLDLQMPVMNGYEAAQEIRKLEDEENKFKIIAMTGDAHPDVKEKCLQSGMDDYLSKPVQKQELHDVVRKWMKNPKASGC